MVLVFPGISSDDNHIHGMLMNWLAPELAAGRDGIGTGRFEDYFFQDLIPYIDATFPTLPGGAHRGVAGFSLGGFMAFKAAAQYPQLFGSASAYDGTFLYAADAGSAVRPTDGVLRNPMFAPALGEPRNLAFVAANNPANLVLQAEAAALQRITWMIQYGPRSGEPWAANYYRGEHMLRCLRWRGLDNGLPVAAIPNGTHTWHMADLHMAEALPVHYSALRPT
jgi:S-formylglutathione hydrolase FrmB